jgi:hypothetical protein
MIGPLFIANVLALSVLLAYVTWLAYPSSEAVRLRNALLLRRGSEGDFSWTPDSVPGDFRRERFPPIADYAAIVRSLGIAEMRLDWNKAQTLAAHLVEHAGDKGPIRADLSTTYCRIQEGYGYCADFVKAYLGLAHAAGLFARQWAFSFDGFGGHGHTFVEVFDRQRGRWVFLDIFNNFHAVDASNGDVLSALDFRDFAAGRRDRVAMRPNGPGRPGFIYEAKALDYYRRGVPEWYMWWGNAVFSYYAHPLMRVVGRLSQTLSNLLAIAVGLHSKMQIYPVPENREQTRQIFALRRRLHWIGALLLLLSALLSVQLALDNGARG